MVSYFSLTLDTTAPSGLSLVINDGATYTTSTLVSLKISLSDTDTTGYQMKIWGTTDAETESSANWETFATTKSVDIPTGDGTKTLYIKVRDIVRNETTSVSSSITLDTAVPVVTASAPDVTTISKVDGYNTCSFTFKSNVAFTEYVVKVVPDINSLHTAGTAIGITNGSTNMSATGTFDADTAISCAIKGRDLETASSGDGAKIIKVFIKNVAGNWSVA